MDELTAMLGEPDPKPSEEKWEAPKRAFKLPDALVLFNWTTTCRCGEKFVTPNKLIAVRSGGNLHGIREGMWRTEYNNLPKEVREFENEVIACSKCFGEASFSYTDFFSSNK